MDGVQEGQAQKQNKQKKRIGCEEKKRWLATTRFRYHEKRMQVGLGIIVRDENGRTVQAWSVSKNKVSNSAVAEVNVISSNAFVSLTK